MVQKGLFAELINDPEMEVVWSDMVNADKELGSFQQWDPSNKDMRQTMEAFLIDKAITRNIPADEIINVRAPKTTSGGGGGSTGGASVTNVASVCSGSKLIASYVGYWPLGQAVCAPLGSSFTRFLSIGNLVTLFWSSGWNSTQPGNSTIGKPICNVTGGWTLNISGCGKR